MRFYKYIGIDYSGRGTPLTRTAGLQVYVATNDRLPKRVNPPSTPAGRNRNWCRKEVAEWLITQANSGKPFIAGLDFSFSLPPSYFQRYGLTDGNLDGLCLRSVVKPMRQVRKVFICCWTSNTQTNGLENCGLR